MKEKGKVFPLFVSLNEKRILIVGAGKVAARRAGALLSSGAGLTIIAPECSEEMAAVIKKENNSVIWKEREFLEEDVDGYELIFAATSDKILNHEISVLCRKKGLPVNNASDKADCDFFFPAILQEEGLTIGVSSGGMNHKKVAAVCGKLREFFAGSGSGEKICAPHTERGGK